MVTDSVNVPAYLKDIGLDVNDTNLFTTTKLPGHSVSSFDSRFEFLISDVRLLVH